MYRRSPIAGRWLRLRRYTSLPASSAYIAGIMAEICPDHTVKQRVERFRLLVAGLFRVVGLFNQGGKAAAQVADEIGTVCGAAARQGQQRIQVLTATLGQITLQACIGLVDERGRLL